VKSNATKPKHFCTLLLSKTVITEFLRLMFTKAKRINI